MIFRMNFQKKVFRMPHVGRIINDSLDFRDMIAHKYGVARSRLRIKPKPTYNFT